MSTANLKPPRGMRDFYPEDMVARNAVFDAWRTAAGQFGFSDYDACVVESLDLLTRKAGEEIVDQIYTFKDKSGRDLALRPEMTPSLARMVAARQGALAFPLKWSTIAQCFRYERTTRGRKREHYQWNLDIIGEPGVAAEVELIATAVHALSQLQLSADDVRVHFSSRSLLAAILSSMAIPESHHAATFLVLDKRGKIDDTAMRTLLQDAGLDEAAIARVFELLAITTLEQALAPLPPDHPCRAELAQFMALLDSYGIADYVDFDISIVRGLAYYTGIVFEGLDVHGEFRAIFGGGRYDNLLGDVGGRPATGVGLGFGDVVIGELLAERNKLPTAEGRAATVIGFMTEDQQITATTVARAIRASGQAVDLGLRPEKAKAFFTRAGKSAAGEAIYIGPDDVAAGTVNVKNLATREQKTLSISDLR